MKKTVRINMMQERAVFDALPEVLIDTTLGVQNPNGPPPPKTCKYKEGHSDETVASSFSFTCRPATVARIRKEAGWGLLNLGHNTGGLAASIADLRARMDAVDGLLSL